MVMLLVSFLLRFYLCTLGTYSCMDGAMGGTMVRHSLSGNQVDDRDMMDMAYK